MSKRGNLSPPSNPRVLRSRMDGQCTICNVQITDNDVDHFVICSNCKLSFHNDCVGVTQRFYHHFIAKKGSPWYCHVCNVEIRKQINRNALAIEELDSTVETMKKQFLDVNIEIQKLHAIQQTSTQAFELEVMEKVETVLSNFQTTQVSEPPSVTSSAQNTGRRKNVVIRGITEIVNENVSSIVKQLAKLLNFNQNNFIDNCFRLPSRETADGYPSPILLKFNTELARDAFLKSYFSLIKKKPLKLSDIGLTGNDRIFINEHMDPKLHAVLKKSLALRKAKVFTNVSTHCNHISVKDVNGWHRIYSMEDLLKITNTSQ